MMERVAGFKGIQPWPRMCKIVRLGHCHMIVKDRVLDLVHAWTLTIMFDNNRFSGVENDEISVFAESSVI